MSQEWFCSIDGQTQGPLDVHAVRDLAEKGLLKPTDLVWRHGDTQSKAAGTIKGLTFRSRATVNQSLPSNVPSFVYKMVQVPSATEVASGIPVEEKVAAYLEGIVNEYAQKGWEFYRVDSISILVMPGCLAAFLGFRPTKQMFHVVCFRRAVAT